MPTFFPCFAKPMPINDEIVDFPTPPFPEEIPIIRFPTLKFFFTSSIDRSALTNLLAEAMSSVVGSINFKDTELSNSLIISVIADWTQSILK